MDKQVLNCHRSRARMEIQTHGGRVTGWHPKLPIVYAIAPLSGPLWPVVEVAEKSGGVIKTTRTSNIDWPPEPPDN